jgi:hypothetical protein
MFHGMKKALGVGVIVGICRCYMVVVDFIFSYFLEMWWPAADIPKSEQFDYKTYVREGR